ncbi:MAG: hypothetical protein ABI885_29265 [Gammaproteobacteria bacterium]
MTDEEFLQALEDTTLPSAEFDHVGHVRAAFLCLAAARDFPSALARICASIRKYAAALGQPGRYHETITVGYTALIYQRMHADASCGKWREFATANPDLFNRQLLNRFFPPELLASDLARNVFILPPRCACETSRSAATA